CLPALSPPSVPPGDRSRNRSKQSASPPSQTDSLDQKPSPLAAPILFHKPTPQSLAPRRFAKLRQFPESLRQQAIPHSVSGTQRRSFPLLQPARELPSSAGWKPKQIFPRGCSTR